MTIVDFFDPYNVEHMKAFEVLNTTGCWPVGFVADDIEIPHTWIIGLYGKISNAWLEKVKNGHVFGVPSFYQ